MNDNLYNLSFERSALSSMLYNPELFDEKKDFVNSSDFYLPSHQNIFIAMGYLSDNNKPINEEFIKKELLKTNSFDEAVMMEIMMANPVANITSYINEIKDSSNQRKLINLSTKIKDDIGVDEKLEIIKKQIEEIESNSEDIEDFNGEELMETQFENKVVYDSGISPLDKIVGGVEKGQLIYITGAEEAGKTHLSYKMMENLSAFSKVGIISLEFGKRKLKERLQGMVSKGHSLNPKNIKASFESHSINKIEKIIKKWASDGVGFIVLDSFNLVENFKNTDNNQNVIDTGRRLFKLTQQLDILLLVISTSTKADHKEGNPSIYGGQLLNHYCDQKWHILRDLGTEERLLWVNKNKQNYKYGKEVMHFLKDGSINSFIVEETEYREQASCEMPEF